MDAQTQLPDFLGIPLAAQWNYTQPLENLKMDSNMVWLLCSLLSSIIWVIYITFYHSRVMGYFITKLANRLFIKAAYFRIGSLTLNPLAGKIMFRDIVYICFDYTIRIQDGYFIFRWWRAYVPKDVSEDLSHSDTRLSVMLNGLEMHVYNRCDLYSKLEKTFGLKPTILIPTENMSSDEASQINEQAMNVHNLTTDRTDGEGQTGSARERKKKPRPEAMTATTWRDLIPVIKIDICSSRFVFGNRLTPTTLSICIEEAHCVYSTKPAVSRLDHFMHFVKAKAENAKVLLAPSPKYTGLVDEPPRYMGEGFVVMMSNLLELYFYMDEAGVVPEQPVLLTLANGDVVEAAPPMWGIDIKCGKGTDFSYGPWADRQRDHLFRFFFPPDWQTMQVTQPPKPGDRRQYQTFEVSLSTLDRATIDILFSKNKETNAVHVITGPGSYLEVTLPWITLQDGFTTKVTGQLLGARAVEATTSLQYRSLGECETLQFNVKVHYPLRWNDHQEWNINLTGSKATAYVVYSHKDFFQDLIEDWASKSRPDILYFVPYTWKFSILLKEFELITLSNEYNWIDCSSTNQENHHLAFCGDLFDLSFTLPFDDFLPPTVPLKFWIHGEGLDLSLYLPEVSTSRPILIGLDENARILTRDGHVRKRAELMTKKWRRICQRTAGWIDCWTVPIVALAIQYIYHPIPPLGPDPQADITTPEKEEILLSPMRIPKLRKSPVITWTQSDQRFDPTTLPPDKVTVELEIGSSVLFAYGAVLRNFIHLKENIFGEDQTFTDMEMSNIKTSPTQNSGLTKATLIAKDDQTKSVSEVSVGTEEKPKRFDPRLYRPFEVTVTVTIHDIQAHLIKNCTENDPPCPIILIERLGFEMTKTFTETQLQVLVSPSFLIIPDNLPRSPKDKHLKQGHLLLSAVQVRGHAMFSNEGRSLDEDTLEYGWLLEVQLGKLSGKLTLQQMCHLVTGLETFLMLAIDSENQLRPSKNLRYCHHGVPSNLCPHSKEDTRYRCPSCEDIKYRMTRVAIDAMDIYLVESGTALHTWISPIRISTCNLHGQQVKSGITGLLPTVLIRQFVSTGGHFTHINGNSHSNTNTTGSGRSSKIQTHYNQQQHPGKEGTDKKEDLNVLFKREEHVKGKKEGDHGVHRKESREKEDLHARRSRENEHHYKREKEDTFTSVYSSVRDRAREVDQDPWLEVGCVSFGPIIIEAASALPIPEHCLHLVQHNYLKVHDEKSKRLWFLWGINVENTKCGCVGGCAFFGSNRNGMNFFKPTAQDLHDNVNIARYHIHPNPKEYGFGQSLLHEGQLVFHTPPYSLQPVTLQECYEYISKPNLRGSRHGVDTKSPLPVQKQESIYVSKSDTSPNSTLIKPCADYHEKTLPKMKEKGSPLSGERRGRRFSYTNSRQNIHDVPYARLIDTPSKGGRSRDQCDGGRLSHTGPIRQDSASRLSAASPRGLQIPPPKTSASDSRLTVDYFHPSDELDLSVEMSSSAPPPQHPLQSDSEQSLSPHIISEEAINREVQRTISLTSENPSEAFFSADEDIHASRSSSLKTADIVMHVPKKRFASDLSIGGQNDLDSKLSTHRSDYEINTPEHRSLPKRPQSTAEFTGDERRIHGLATPLRKFSNISPRPEFRHFKPVYDHMDSQESSSDSPSLSSTSFISALSSQEDITLVNLHMQVNRPIVDSPLLMASYVTHLAQVRCTNWSHCSLPYGADSFSMPLFQQNEDGGLVYIGGKMVPHFDTCSNWREVRILTRSDPATSSTLPSSSGLPKSHPWDPSIMIKNDEQEKHKESEENEFISPMGGETATRNSVVVRCKGQADVMVTPLLLEGLQRMIESLTPTLATLHPLTIINYLHGSCIRKVEAANILKRDQSLSYWSQVHSNSKRSTAERNLQGPGGPVLTDVYEESISTQLQGLVVLPKISVSMIQSSVVEEVISFAALDNVQDLSCASLLVVCFDSISTRFHFAKTTKASMHTFTQPAMRSGGLKKGGIIRGTTRALLAHLSSQSRPDNVPGEPVLIETSEKQLEELVVTLDIGKAHAQLRRLKNEGCALQENQTIVTAIPAHRSRAMFECTKYPEEPSLEPFGLGFIMFEGGLEGIGVKIVKRSQFEKSENAQDRLKEQPAEVETSVEVQALAKKSNQQPASTSATDSAPNTGKLGENRLSGGGISKKPLTPKPSTPKEKLMMGLDFNKSRDKESGSKDGKTPQVPQPKPTETVITVEEEAPGKEGSGAKAQPAAGGGSTAVVAKKNDNGKTSSCIIDLKTVWFNFAAPPRVPITRKIDYTRLDWNLLSTASPAITAWMNPSNRFAIKLVSMMKAMHQRRTAVAASLMADGLEVQGIHRPPKSRYSRKLTPLSKTLQEDPSCQLCTIMQKYILQESVEKVEANLKQQDLPQLNVLRQGVIVLSRQWKNTLYNPMLFEHQYKNKLIQPVNVAFSMQPLDEDCDDVDDMDTETYPMGVINDSEETERTMLLGQGVVPHRNVIKLPDDAGATSVHNSKLSDSVNTSPSLKSGKGNRKKSIKTQQSSTRHSSIQMFPIISGFVEKQEPQIEYGTLRDGSLPSICSSSDSLEKAWSPPPNHKEDLYSWMAKQQHESEKKEHRERHQDRPATPVRPTGTTTVVQSSNGYVQDSVRLLDAHLIFEPLLSCLGVMPQQMVNNNPNPDVSLDSLGTNLSLVGSFDTLRIDIVVSEAGDKKPKAKIGKKSNGKFVLTMPPETPAFLCERVGVEIEVLKMADGFPEDANPNVLYLSRGQLKKHTSTVINFSLNIRYISQQVNMPLLRLLHQITNMYQNVKEAQNELREQPETGKRSVPIKDESSLASEMNDPTLLGSIHEPISQLDSSIMDEHYDKFNESYPIGHSISRTRLPSLGPLIPLTPSPSSRNRPQSFAQKLRSTSKSVKGKLGYINLTETVSTPIKTSPTVSTFEQAYPALQRNPVESKYSLTGAASSTYGDYAAPFGRSSFEGPTNGTIEHTIVTPKCWKTIYHLLNLYATMPETKTVCHRVSVSPDAIDNFKSIRRSNIERKSSQRGGGGGEGAAGGDDVDGNGTPVPPAAGVVANERTRLVVFGVAKIHRTRLLATLSGLKLEAEITALQSSATWRKKSRPAVLECSLTGHIGRAMIVLLEGVAPSQQTVVKVTVGKSQTLYSSVSRRGKDKNSGLLSIGPVNIDIPQHPVALHGMMTRSSKQLSSTLQELRVTRSSARLSRQNDEPDSPMHARDAKEKQAKKPMSSSKAAAGSSRSALIQPLVMQFNVILQSLSVTAALLPSLQAQYKMDHVSSTGVTGSKAKFTIDLPSHSLSFTTKIHASEANLPSEASIALPPVHVSAEYVPENAPQDVPIDGVVLRQGGYVSASAEIGVFERCLTTDLLNHLVFVQKVFMKEVNEVVQKVYGGEKPVPLWLEESDDNGSSLKRILFSLNIRVKQIQLTATTPCNSAVRFETGQLELHLSNRVKNLAEGSSTKLFGKAQIDLNLSLGQIIKNVMFDEAEPEFQQYAFFNTTIGLRNAFQDEMLNDDKELVLITLKRPLIYIQPVAVDKAILVWLNYKNAYEYWAEKRANLNKEVLTATQQVFEKVPFGQLSQHLSTPNLSTLFLQLTVEDMGICMPLNPLPLTNWGQRSIQDFESHGAVVITLENTIISACNSGSLVSKGRFVGLCLRFADDFETSLDDWKPNMNDSSIMNLCVVSEGTYEVCSRTIAAKQYLENAKWILNVTWQMEGVDIHLDVNIGKQLSALGHTLTMLTGSEEDEPITVESADSDEGDQTEDKFEEDPTQSKRSIMESLPSFVFDPAIDTKKRSLMMEKEMNEQLKIISDLRTLGASYKTVAQEERRLQELQALCYKYFRRDMIQKWKRPSMRRSMLKTANRSRSFVIQSPTKEDLLECGEIHLPEKVNDGDGGSLQSSPHSGPSRSASLKMRIPTGPRVTFTDTMRQSSLPSADSEMNFHDGGGLEWPSYDSSMQEIPHMLDIDGEQVELRKKSPNHPVKQQDPNVDFELDIKVLVNSGKCVLYTKEPDDRITSTLLTGARHHKRERSTGTDWGSPVPPRRNKDKSRLRYNANHTLLTELTIFHIPGLDVKLNYQSKTIPDDSSPRLSTTESFSSGRRLGSKRASLFAWMTLQSIPEETIISPHILEFLEQTLEPIPKTSLVAPSNPVNIDLLQGNYVAYASFPVDVIVYFHMQPSTFRFSCLPVSRVECMLQLPSLDIVFSSKRQESGPEHEAKTTSGGGLSVTGCLADFNVYIFHPYGGKKSGIKEAQFSPLADSERKDSLSINVEFVKFHLTRSRTVNYESLTTKKSDQRAVIRFSTIVDIGSASFKYDMRRLTEILAFPKAWYRHSIVRRLFLGDLSVQQTSTGDLDFTPSDEGKGYTKSVGGSSSERSPLLKEKLRLNFDNDVVSKGMKLKDMEKSSSLDSNTSPSEPNQVTAWETLVLFAVNFKKLNVQMNMGNVMGNVVWLTKAFRSEGRLSIGSTGHKNMYIGIGLGSSTLDAKGGIVGGTIELSKIDTHMRVQEEPGCQPHHMMGIKFLALELRLDYMGTSVLMKRISSLNAALEDKWENSCDGEVDGRPKKPPVILIHGDLSWDQLQVLISKSTTADLLKMFYKLEEFFSQQFKSSKRVFSSLEPRFSTTASGRTNSLKRRQMQFKKRTISVTDSGIVTPRDQSAQDARHHRHWQKPLKQVLGFYLPSFAGDAGQGTVLGGTMELHGNNISLACFHGINFKSKSWALFSLRDPCINFATEAQPIENTEDVHINQTLIFSLGMSARTQPQSHSMATVCRMTRNIIFPPQFKTLHEWFHYAFANSEIDSVDRFPVLERERPEPNTNSIEKVRQGAAGGGPQAKSQDPNHNREVIFALPSLRLQFKTEHMQGAATPESSQDEKPVVECSFITEFEDHIFVTVDADAFFFLHDLITSYLKEKEKVLAAAGYTRSASPNVPTASGSNVSQGQNSMGSDGKLAAGTAADADGTMVNGSDGASMQQQPNLTVSEDKAVKIDKMDMEAFVKDWRDFVCRTWHLEPTVRLLSWAGKSIEPYGIDYILNKLGFSHARTTIPKWLQRGFMDPLDKLQALMMLQLLSMVKENRVQNN
ncbi:bridge-like lipid transfer protein family member 1 isoform X2 [Lutzomyia longipalpis]|uniref:bridge-like lipid transfer protein family member 1 isoform X2 n=1 Tax=Lutzomyia longipalpis TaxID=7200 RepID=UPI00248415E9|nr:bridge-like lipid transfer protein family member 1 isoform X2 [Lutzomyia longipalpis]